METITIQEIAFYGLNTRRALRVLSNLKPYFTTGSKKKYSLQEFQVAWYKDTHCWVEFSAPESIKGTLARRNLDLTLSDAKGSLKRDIIHSLSLFIRLNWTEINTCLHWLIVMRYLNEWKQISKIQSGNIADVVGSEFHNRVKLALQRLLEEGKIRKIRTSHYYSYEMITTEDCFTKTLNMLSKIHGGLTKSADNLMSIFLCIEMNATKSRFFSRLLQTKTPITDEELAKFCKDIRTRRRFIATFKKGGVYGKRL